MAIVWYSWETHLLKKETRWATEISNRPFLSPGVTNVSPPAGEWPHQSTITITNIGKGAALKVTGELVLSIDSKKTTEEKRISILPIGETGKESWQITLFDGQTVSGSLRLEYYDVLNNKYHSDTLIEMDKTGNPTPSLAKWG